ncbi:MAG: diguanylate cyclase, partial [Deltaproteobacteria bacterium]|nr:diguanylate cyclase [Deltaproteobacteria bacterium]
LGTQEGLVRYDGQEFVVFDKYNTEAMLESQVHALAIGNEGELWIGTEGGLLLYKRGIFQAFTEISGLPHHVITSIAVGYDESVWVGTRGGLARFGGGGTRQVWTDAEGLLSSHVRSIAVAINGDVWVATGMDSVKRGLQRLKGDKLTTILSGEAQVGRGVSSLLPDVDGGLWAGTRGSSAGLIHVSANLKIESYFEKDGLSDDDIMSLYRDSAQSLWIGTYKGGLNRFRDGEFATIEPVGGLSHQRVESLYEDREGSLWVGTGTGGLYRFRDGQFSSLTVDDGLPGPLVWSVYPDPKGGLLVGGDRGFAVVTGGRVTRRYSEKDGLLNNVVAGFYREPKGDLWIATEGGVTRMRNGRFENIRVSDGLSNPDIRVVTGDGDGGVYVGSHGGGVNHLRSDGTIDIIDTEDGLTHNEVSAIFRDSMARVWVGTSEGLSRIEEDGSVTKFSQVEGFTTSSVFTVYEDSKNRIWVGSVKGLYLYRAGKFIHFTVRSGLFDDKVYTILEDDQGYFWMSCNKGVSRVAVSELLELADGLRESVTNTSFGTEDGMCSSECNFGGGNSGARLPDGTLAFPTIAGVAFIDPLEETSTRSPPVLIEKVVADNRVIRATGDWLAPAGVENIAFHFAAPSFIVPEKIRFSYRLIGLNSEWVEAGSRRVAHYANLQPGSYKFEVRSRNKYGEDSKSDASFSFTLTPQFHQTQWFYVVTVLLGFLAVLVFHRYRVRSLEDHEATLALLVRERTEQLERANVQLVEQSFRDPLTGLRNRRFVLESIEKDIASVNRAYFTSPEVVERNDDGLVFVMLDLDHFKSVNDSYGHVAGDRVLQQVSGILKAAGRLTDSVVRWGGEEFLLIARNTGPDSAPVLARRIRQAFKRHVFEVSDGVKLQLTCSLGWACYPFIPADCGVLSWEEVVGVADKALYAAKNSGRDSWVGVVSTAKTPEDYLYKLIRADVPGLLAAGELTVLASIEDHDSIEWDP